MTWLLAVVLRPFAALVLLGFVAFVAYCVLQPLIPSGRLKTLLYDRSIKKRHPWKFGVLALIACYGTMALVSWVVTR